MTQESVQRATALLQALGAGEAARLLNSPVDWNFFKDSNRLTLDSSEEAEIRSQFRERAACLSGGIRIRNVPAQKIAMPATQPLETLLLLLELTEGELLLLHLPIQLRVELAAVRVELEIGRAHV